MPATFKPTDIPNALDRHLAQDVVQDRYVQEKRSYPYNDSAVSFDPEALRVDVWYYDTRRESSGWKLDLSIEGENSIIDLINRIHWVHPSFDIPGFNYKDRIDQRKKQIETETRLQVNQEAPDMIKLLLQKSRRYLLAFLRKVPVYAPDSPFLNSLYDQVYTLNNRLTHKQIECLIANAIQPRYVKKILQTMIERYTLFRVLDVLRGEIKRLDVVDSLPWNELNL